MFFYYRTLFAPTILTINIAINHAAYAETVLPAAQSTNINCSENYYQGTAPDFTNPVLSRGTRELCFDGFTIMYSNITRTPLWSAEHLTKDRIEHAQQLARLNSFHEESQLPFEERATLEDYKGSGFDRGHMSPNGDMGTREQQYNSFSLSNIVPQNSYNNQNPWRLLEDATRELIKQEGEAYVITGVAFRGASIRKIGNVLVPSDIYKVVYFPTRQAAGVYFSPNDASGQVNVISLAELNAQTGLDLLPNLPTSVKQQRVNMPLSTKIGIRHGEIKSREDEVMASTNQTHQPLHYGISASSQTLPATRGLFVRIWKALWQNE